MKYSEKMMSDSFDGSQGFAIDGGIKDATSVGCFIHEPMLSLSTDTFAPCRRRCPALCQLLTSHTSTC
jgi:hypothetical protein